MPLVAKHRTENPRRMTDLTSNAATAETAEEKAKREASLKSRWNPMIFFDIAETTTIDGKPQELGRMVFELYGNRFSRRAERFRRACATGYRGTRIHRVTKNYGLFGGQIVNSMNGGGDENVSNLLRDEKNMGTSGGFGTIYVWKKDQFFISTCDLTWLNGKLPVVGVLVSGREILERIDSSYASITGKLTTSLVVSNCGEISYERAVRLNEQRRQEEYRQELKRAAVEAKRKGGKSGPRKRTSSFGPRYMRGDLPPLHTKIRVLQDNPKREGSASAARYDKYKSAKTLGEYLELGGSTADARYDSHRGYLEFLIDGDAAQTRAPSPKRAKIGETEGTTPPPNGETPA